MSSIAEFSALVMMSWELMCQSVPHPIIYKFVRILVSTPRIPKGMLGSCVDCLRGGKLARLSHLRVHLHGLAWAPLGLTNVVTSRIPAKASTLQRVYRDLASSGGRKEFVGRSSKMVLKACTAPT